MFHTDGVVERREREVITPSTPEARATYKGYRDAQIAEEEADRDAQAQDLHAKRVEWLHQPELQPYLQWLCSLPPDAEQYRQEVLAASGKLGIVPKRNPGAVEGAEQAGYAVFDCEEILNNPSGATPSEDHQ